MRSCLEFTVFGVRIFLMVRGETIETIEANATSAMHKTCSAALLRLRVIPQPSQADRRSVGPPRGIGNRPC